MKGDIDETNQLSIRDDVFGLPAVWEQIASTAPTVLNSWQPLRSGFVESYFSHIPSDEPDIELMAVDRTDSGGWQLNEDVTIRAYFDGNSKLDHLVEFQENGAQRYYQSSYPELFTTLTRVIVDTYAHLRETDRLWLVSKVSNHQFREWWQDSDVVAICGEVESLLVTRGVSVSLFPLVSTR